MRKEHELSNLKIRKRRMAWAMTADTIRAHHQYIGLESVGSSLTIVTGAGANKGSFFLARINSASSSYLGCAWHPLVVSDVVAAGCC